MYNIHPNTQVPVLAAIAVGIGFLISVVFNIRHWSQFVSRTIGLVCAWRASLPWDVYDQPYGHAQDGVKASYCRVLFTVGAFSSS